MLLIHTYMSGNAAEREATDRLGELTQLLVRRLDVERDRLRVSFGASGERVGVRHCVVDDLLPECVARDIYRAFPATREMRLLDSFREKKYTTKNLDKCAPLLAEVTFAIQAAPVLAAVAQITGIQDQIPDPSLYAGGLSAMARGHFLGPHIDNSHDASGRFYRTLNLLYYLTPDWSLGCGGNLELWDRTVKRSATIVSQFNRLVIMETHPWSWHSVSEVKVDRVRCCVSNYYFSPRSPTGAAYRNVTSFSARPEQRFRRTVAWADGKLRNFVRLLVPGGVGKQDIFRRPRP